LRLGVMLKFSSKMRLGMLISVMLIKKTFAATLNASLKIENCEA